MTVLLFRIKMRGAEEASQWYRLAVDSLRLAITVLQDSVTRLEAANAAAYRSGYDAAGGGVIGRAVP